MWHGLDDGLKLIKIHVIPGYIKQMWASNQLRNRVAHIIVIVKRI